MGDNASQSSHLRIVGALSGVGSGLTKVAVGHGCVRLACNSAGSHPRLDIRLSFDTIKTRLQCSPPGTYVNALDVLRKIIRNEGVLALYKGATPPAVGWAAIDSILLGSLHNYRLFLLRRGWTEDVPETGLKRLTLLAHGTAGLFAGITSTALATPIELVKVKLQLQLQKAPADRQFKGPIDCTRQILRAQGITGLWTGLTGSVAFRSNFFWMFLSFEAIMRGFSRLQGTRYEISTGFANFLSGGLGSFAFWAMAIPADNVKNRMMSHPYPNPYPSTWAPRSTSSRPSFASIARYIYVVEGPSGFFRGLGPCILRAFPVNACAFFVYEGMMRGLGAEVTRH